MEDLHRYEGVLVKRPSLLVFSFVLAKIQCSSVRYRHKIPDVIVRAGTSRHITDGTDVTDTDCQLPHLPLSISLTIVAVE